MTPYYEHAGITIYHGDALTVLRELPSESVYTCVTSPPYWGLRDYGTATWEGGDEGCDHVGMSPRTVSGGDGKQYTNEGSNRVYSGDCKCGARRIDSQLGLESTPEEYVAKMVEVFREVRRVLRDDGTLWLNLGDSYANSGLADASKVGGFTGERIRKRLAGESNNDGAQDSRPRSIPPGLKPKDLCGIPWRVAFALQADGWYLRQDIIWHKPNPMPESVTDRCTKAHEYMFLLAKSQRYYFDGEAIAEPLSTRPHAPGNIKLDESRNDHDQMDKVWGTNGTRNRRSVWTINTQPYPSAHFATFPPKLIEPCIKAGCPDGEIVLDPFLGSGTTAEVARRLNCRCIGIELNEEYIELCKRRLKQEVFDFTKHE